MGRKNKNNIKATIRNFCTYQRGPQEIRVQNWKRSKRIRKQNEKTGWKNFKEHWRVTWKKLKKHWKSYVNYGEKHGILDGVNWTKSTKKDRKIR